MEPYLFSFEKPEVWQMSRKLTISVYQATSRFPPVLAIWVKPNYSVSEKSHNPYPSNYPI